MNRYYIIYYIRHVDFAPIALGNISQKYFCSVTNPYNHENIHLKITFSKSPSFVPGINELRTTAESHTDILIRYSKVKSTLLNGKPCKYSAFRLRDAMVKNGTDKITIA